MKGANSHTKYDRSHLPGFVHPPEIGSHKTRLRKKRKSETWREYAQSFVGQVIDGNRITGVAPINVKAGWDVVCDGGHARRVLMSEVNIAGFTLPSCRKCAVEVRAAFPREYRSWSHVLRRCRQGHPCGYDTYDKVVFVRRWLSFQNFMEDMGPMPDDGQRWTIDRINRSNVYGPGNCRWALAVDQVRNRRNTVWVTFRGKTLTLLEWSVKLGVTYKTLHSRKERGWSVERMLTTPIRKLRK